MSVSPIHTKIWLEEPANDPSTQEVDGFSTAAAYCHGYDYYREVLGNASWSDSIYLMFKGEQPTKQQSTLLNHLAVAIANPGPRDPSVHAAMCGGIGGSPSASHLIAALAVGAGQVGGSREVFLAMKNMIEFGEDFKTWEENLNSLKQEIDVWPDKEIPAGFEPNLMRSQPFIHDVFHLLNSHSDGIHLKWLGFHWTDLSNLVGKPISLQFVVAATMLDLGMTPEVGEMLHLIFRLPGAAAHSLEQSKQSFKNFPFYPIEILNDPKKDSNG